MKVKVLIALVIVFALIGTNTTYARYSGGTGEPNNPYRIATPNDLNDIGNHVEDFNKCFVMVNDINLADYTGTEFNIIGYFNNSVDNEPFTGVFDGNGQTISNFTYTSTGADFIGLFGYVDDANAEIKDLTLIDPNVDAGTGGCVGSLVGNIEEGTISGCGIKGASVVAGGGVGGLVGVIGFAYYAPWQGGSIIVINCYANANTSGNNVVGGLAGGNSGGTITGSYSTGTVSGNYDEVGGLVGANYDANISNSYSAAIVTGDNYVGGLVGSTFEKYSEATISYSYATGSVTATGIAAGGLVGYNQHEVTISNCYATANVTGDTEVGGLLGSNGFSTISNSYAVGKVDGNDFTGGLVGYDHTGFYASCFWDSDVNPDVNGLGGGDADPNVIGLPTAQMQMEATFTDAGWDFVEIWNIGENQTYPYLRVYPAGDIDHDDKVNLYDLAITAEHWLEGT